jgi:GAF domain-containing protein
MERRAVAPAEDRAQRLTTLHVLTKLITSDLEGPTVFNAIAHAACTLMGAKVARVWVADPEKQVLRALGSHGVDPEIERRLLDATVLPYGGGIPGPIFTSGQPEYISDSCDDPRWFNAQFIREMGLHGYAGLPLIAGGRGVGVLSILFGEVKTFTDEEKEFTSLLAGQAAIAIKNVRLYEDAQRLAAIVQASDDAILSVGLDGIVLSWNPGAERMYGTRAARR